MMIRGEKRILRLQDGACWQSRLPVRGPDLQPPTTDADIVCVAVSLLEIDMLAVADSDPDAVTVTLCWHAARRRQGAE